MASDDRPISEITELLLAWGEGRRDALDDLMPVVYDDLRRIASGYMRRERPGHALQPTALVSEAYVRLVDQRRTARTSSASRRR